MIFQRFMAAIAISGAIQLALLQSVFSAPITREEFYSNKNEAELIARLSEESGKTKQSVERLLKAMGRSAPSKLFSEIGKTASFDFVPDTYTAHHAISYYIPASLSIAENNVRCLVYMHGGGASTSTYETAKAVAERYLESFKNTAEKNHLILIFPSTYFGWASHAPHMMRDLSKVIRRELPCDPNQIFLAGHSMGGMGMVRESTYMTDLFAGFYSAASGPRDENISEALLAPYLNTTFVQINGLRDQFTSFLEQVKKVKAVLTQYASVKKVPLTYDLKLFDTDHSGAFDQQVKVIDAELSAQKTPIRNLYSKRLFAYFWHQQNYKYPGSTAPELPANKSNSTVKWLEALELEGGSGRAQAEGQIIGNVVDLHFSNTVDPTKIETRIKSFRVYLSSHMVNFGLPVVVKVNGIEVFNQMVYPTVEQMVKFAREKGDHTFLYGAAVDIQMR